MDPLPSSIRSERLLVRRWRPNDAPALHEAILASMDHLRPWMPWIAEEPLSVDDRRRMIERWDQEAEAGGDTVYGVWDAGAVVAGAGLHHRLGPAALEIGYWVRAGFLRRGIATEAAALLTEAAFSAGDILRVEIHHDVANVASGRVPAKLGYGRIREIAVDDPLTAPAETGRRVLWRITRQGWTNRTPPQAPGA